ncbi:MAG TPA: coproporphyrinogen-III oxidase family protein [Thermoanaerobaculia bacterium]|nr:coproporphyrinogen-III oxidase family protein [Thermoanaerobaculia bacterium]
MATNPEPATLPVTEKPSTGSTEVGSVFVSNYPLFSAWKAEHLSAVEAALASPPRPDAPLGLYLHIPFCRKRCKFCYFRVYTDKDSTQIGAYLDALAREVEILAEQPAVAGRPLQFVYFGGGTPSYISVRQLEGLVSRIRAVLPWDGVREVTFECEPGTLTRSKLEALREIGITRLSLGIENFDDEILRENGRAHVSQEIYRVLPWIRELGFDQLNIDLIAGMVGERWETWKETVRKTVEAAPDSVTIYQMELPYNTVYSQGVLGGTLGVPLADWETKRAWNDYAIAELSAAGYEISSAYTMVKPKPDGSSRFGSSRFVYRDSVWHGCDLLGTGVASFSHLSGVHYQNVASWNEYLETVGAGRLPLGRAFPTSDRERLTRELILQLKLGRLDPTYFQEKFGVDVLADFAPAWRNLEAEGMLRLQDGGVELTRAGLLQVDRLLPEFYDDRYRGARYT